MENKGNKSGNIYQKLKGAGAWQSKDSAGPMIKGVGIKSPLNMKKSPAKLSPPPGIAEKAQQMKKDGKGPYDGKGSSSKKDPYAKAAKVDPKLGEYVKQRKGLKKDSAEYAKVQNKINKAYGVKKRYDEKPKDVTTNTGGGDDDKKVTTTTEVTKTPPVEKKEENVVKKTKKEVRLANKAKRQKKRADRIKKEGGTKVGNFLRKGVKKVKEVVKKKTDGEKISSAAQMKKSALKMKKSAMKMNEGFDKLPADVQAKIKKNK